LGNPPQDSALTGAGGNRREESCTYTQEWPFCGAGHVHVLSNVSDRAMVMGFIEGVTTACQRAPLGMDGM